MDCQSTPVEEDDPHYREMGCYLVPAINLLVTVEHCKPQGLLASDPWSFLPVAKPPKGMKTYRDSRVELPLLPIPTPHSYRGKVAVAV